METLLPFRSRLAEILDGNSGESVFESFDFDRQTDRQADSTCADVGLV